MAMNLHKGDNVNRLHSKVIDTIPYTFKYELLTIKTIKVMIVRKLEEVKNALLHDAILITTLQGYKFNRVYVDNEGGCNIKFSCKMNIDDIKLLLVNLSPNKYLNKSLEDIDIQYYKDYEFTDDCECIIYTPDSFNYNSED